jgi:thioredoxin reductase
MIYKPVVIIGAGPAGLTTAIQLKRYGVETLVIEREESGGLLRNANLVENYPGFPGGIKGKDLVQRFVNQTRSIGIQVTNETAHLVERIEGDYQIVTDKRKYRSAYLVIASGTKPKRLNDIEIPDLSLIHI